MPSQIRGTIFFRMNSGGRPYSWSESVGCVAANDLDTALRSMNDYTQLRSKLLGTGVNIPLVRVSDLGVFRDSRISRDFDKISDIYSGYNTAGALARSTADFPYSILTLRWESTANTLSRRVYNLGGIPDVMQSIDLARPQSSTDVGHAAWTRAFNAWRDLAESGSFGWFGVDNTQVPQRLTNVQGAPDNGFNSVFTFTTQANHGLAIGDTVSIRSIKTSQASDDKPKGRWQVLTVPSVTTFTVLGYGGPLHYLSGGTVKKILITSQTCGKVTPVQFSSRKRGLSFGRPVSARTTRK